MIPYDVNFNWWWKRTAQFLCPFTTNEKEIENYRYFAFRIYKEMQREKEVKDTLDALDKLYQ